MKRDDFWKCLVCFALSSLTAFAGTNEFVITGFTRDGRVEWSDTQTNGLYGDAKEWANRWKPVPAERSLAAEGWMQGE